MQHVMQCLALFRDQIEILDCRSDAKRNKICSDEALLHFGLQTLSHDTLLSTSALTLSLSLALALGERDSEKRTSSKEGASIRGRSPRLPGPTKGAMGGSFSLSQVAREGGGLEKKTPPKRALGRKDPLDVEGSAGGRGWEGERREGGEERGDGPEEEREGGEGG